MGGSPRGPKRHVMGIVIGLSGFRGSGKSTVAGSLVEEFGAEKRSFGDCVRREAVVRLLPTDVPSLQALGAELIGTWGWERFCREALGPVDANSLVVIEGIRHVEALDTLTKIVEPSRFVLVFVDTPADVLATRILARNREGDSAVSAAGDQMEGELLALRSRAEFVVDGRSDAAARVIGDRLQLSRH